MGFNMRIYNFLTVFFIIVGTITIGMIVINGFIPIISDIVIATLNSVSLTSFILLAFQAKKLRRLDLERQMREQDFVNWQKNGF